MLVGRARDYPVILTIISTVAYVGFILYYRLYYLLPATPFLPLTLYPYLKTLVYRRCIGRIDGELLEFLTLLINFESIGLHINDLFRMIASGEIGSTPHILYAARKYLSLERLYSDHVRALSRLSRIYSGTRFSKFLEGYVGILLTTGDTLAYTEAALNEELSRLETSIGGLVGFIENFYESYLIILLTVIVVSCLPGAPRIDPLIYFLLLCINSIAYLLSGYVTGKLYRYEPRTVSMITYLNILAASTLPLLLPPHILLPMILVFQLASIIISRMSIEWRRALEDSLYELTEDLYSETRHGFTVDRALERLSDKNVGYRGIAYEISRLLKTGLKGDRVASAIDTSPLIARVLKMILSPIEYSSDHSRHVGYTVRFLRRLHSIRGRLSLKTRTLYLYTLVLPVTAYAIAYGLLSMASTTLLRINPSGIIGYVISSSIPAWIIACRIGDGYGVYGWKNILVTLENIVLYMLFSL